MYCPGVYLYTKLGAKRSRIGWDIQFCFSKMAVAAILNLLFSHFRPPTMSLLVGSMFPTNDVVISLSSTPTCTPADFWVFTRKLWRHHFNLKRYAFRAEPRLLTYCAWKSVQRSHVYISSKKELILLDNAEMVHFTYGETPPVRSLVLVLLHVGFLPRVIIIVPDVFFTSSFCGGITPKIYFSDWLEGWRLQQLEFYPTPLWCEWMYSGQLMMLISSETVSANVLHQFGNQVVCFICPL